MLIAMLFVMGCTDVHTYSGVDNHDESDNSETTSTE